MLRLSVTGFWKNLGFKKWQLTLTFLSLVFVLIWAFYFINKYSIDLLIEDRADWWGFIVNGGGWFEGFFKQHGPHRLGLLFVLSKFSNLISPLNLTTDLYINAIMMWLTLILGLRLKWKYTRKWHVSDVVIPLVVLSTFQWEVYIVIPHIHVMLPFFALLMGNFLISDKKDSLYLTAILFFLAAFSVYAIFAAAPFLLFQILRWYKQKAFKKAVIASLIGLASAVIYLFNFKYGFMNASPGVDWSIAVKGPYLLALSFLGFNYVFVGAWISGALILGVMALFVWKFFKTKNNEVIYFILSSLSIFIVMQCLGRSHFGEDVFLSTRYYTSMTLFLWIIVLSLKEIPFSKLTQGLWLFLLLGTLFRFGDPRWGQQKIYISKVEKWKECYQETLDVEECNARLKYSVNPNPNKRDLKRTWEIMGQIKRGD